MSDDGTADAARKTGGESSGVGGGLGERLSSLPFPSSPFFYVAVVVGLALIFTGRFLASGEYTGLYGLWGLSLIAAVLLVYVTYWLWCVLD